MKKMDTLFVKIKQQTQFALLVEMTFSKNLIWIGKSELMIMETNDHCDTKIMVSHWIIKKLLSTKEISEFDVEPECINPFEYKWDDHSNRYIPIELTELFEEITE